MRAEKLRIIASALDEKVIREQIKKRHNHKAIKEILQCIGEGRYGIEFYLNHSNADFPKIEDAEWFMAICLRLGYGVSVIDTGTGYGLDSCYGRHILAISWLENNRDSEAINKVEPWSGLPYAKTAHLLTWNKKQLISDAEKITQETLASAREAALLGCYRYNHFIAPYEETLDSILKERFEKLNYKVSFTKETHGTWLEITW